MSKNIKLTSHIVILLSFIFFIACTNSATPEKKRSSFQVEGGLSKEAVKNAINSHLNGIKSCYENALIKQSDIEGKIVYEWKIDLSGDVSTIRVKSSNVNSTDLIECVKSEILTWKFPKPKTNIVTVSYPFIFDIVKKH